MVDIAQPITANTHVSKNAPHVRLPYMIEVKVSPEAMIAAKGSAIAAADVYDLIRIPPQTVIQGVWLKKSEVFVGTSTDITLNLGPSTAPVDADQWVLNWTVDDVAVGSFGFPGVGWTVASAPGLAIETVLTLTVATMTGSWTSGDLRLYVQCLDLSDEPQAGIVQLYT